MRRRQSLVTCQWSVSATSMVSTSWIYILVIGLTRKAVNRGRLPVSGSLTLPLWVGDADPHNLLSRCDWFYDQSMTPKLSYLIIRSYTQAAVSRSQDCNRRTPVGVSINRVKGRNWVGTRGRRISSERPLKQCGRLTLIKYSYMFKMFALAKVMAGRIAQCLSKCITNESAYEKSMYTMGMQHPTKLISLRANVNLMAITHFYETGIHRPNQLSKIANSCKAKQLSWTYYVYVGGVRVFRCRCN